MSASSSEIAKRAQDYVTARGSSLEQRLGFGRDGEVFSTTFGTAVKSFAVGEVYRRELACYQRLAEHEVDEVEGHRVPRLVAWDDDLFVIEMTTVKPPYLLDFASAYVDFAPDFTPEVMEQWREQKIEQFQDRWPDVETVLGIYLFDTTPPTSHSLRHRDAVGCAVVSLTGSAMTLPLIEPM